jgi:hypothetical protein
MGTVVIDAPETLGDLLELIARIIFVQHLQESTVGVILEARRDGIAYPAIEKALGAPLEELESETSVEPELVTVVLDALNGVGTSEPLEHQYRVLGPAPAGKICQNPTCGWLVPPYEKECQNPKCHWVNPDFHDKKGDGADA